MSTSPAEFNARVIDEVHATERKIPVIGLTPVQGS
jgi:hypothetical protein